MSKHESVQRKPKAFTIDVDRWYRGKGGTDSRLLRKQDGMMCCLGQYLAACGVDQDVLRGVGGPVSIKDRLEGKVRDSLLEEWQGDLAGKLETLHIMQYNDATLLTEEDRRKRVREFFAGIDVEVSFSDEQAAEDSVS